MLDVIIPVYRGLAATRRCIESVLSVASTLAHEVVVVDDASPEPEISAWLRSLAEGKRITLVTHSTNRGFVASVNEAMALHPERDVVLLNSDTEVADRWLDRLAACARREPQVATVTPFSNNATLASYPRFLHSSALGGETTAKLDSLFERVNAGQSVEIPTAVGFCMYITRAALNAVGSFDEGAFGKGYGEEVDFCMRASRADFRHLLCADTFVFHEGEVSFGKGAASMRVRAQELIDERYPEFQAELARFIECEPARPLRRRVDVARLSSSARPRLLLVTHAWGGGVERHVMDVARLASGECEVLCLRPTEDGIVHLRWLREGEEFEAWFDPAHQWRECVEVLRAIGLDRIHYHHIHRLPRAVIDLGAELGVPYDVTLHDYFPICPQYHLSPDGVHACEAAAGAACNRCLDARPAQWGLSIEEWRSTFHAFLRKAARVISPSADAAGRIRRYFPDVEILEWSHPEEARRERAAFKVALIGGQSRIKGARVLEACVADAKARNLPLHFHVIGHVDRPMAQWPEAPLSIGGSYPEERLAELIALERPDAFLFLSQVPETYSYTLSAAMQTGLPIVATRLGAFPERLRAYPRHQLVPAESPAAAFNDALVSCMRAAVAPARVPAAG